MNPILNQFFRNKLKSRKHSNVYVFILFIISYNAYSQFPCNYLDYFTPNPTDQIKYVNVTIWKMTYSGWSPWAGVDQADAQLAIDRANASFSMVPAPYATVNITPPIQHITDSRIRLVLKTFTTVVDANVFDDDYAAYTGIGSPNGIYRDDNSINVYLIENTSSIPNYNAITIAYPSLGAPPYGPKQWIKFAQGASDLISNRGVNLAHEVGHILGLSHANVQAEIGFPETGCSTCSISVAYDYVLASTGASCHVNGYSNNLMNSFTGCEEYLSPGQMSVMHYNLMANRPNWLTPSSYTAVTGANSAFDFTVGTSQTWSTPTFYKGNVTIPYGVVLTIQCQVGMQRGGKFIVKPGGKLIIDGGKITNISGQLWEGIDVQGNPSLAQTNGYSWLSHGQLSMTSATLANSINSIRNYGFDAVGHPWLTGGIIVAYNSKFINNVRDVEFLAYPHISASRFDQCEFTTTGQINNGGSPYVHVSMWGVNGVQLNGCYFENAAQGLYPNIGQGMHSIDAIYSIRNDVYGGNSKFIGFSEALDVYNSNPLNTVEVYGTQFDNNFKAIEFSNMKSSIIADNGFTMTPQSSKGVILNLCTDYSIENNLFKGSSVSNSFRVGVYAISSLNGSHRIYRNDFRNLYVGILPQGDNSGGLTSLTGLCMNCNTFTASANNWDIGMVGLASPSFANEFVAKNQGVLTNLQTYNLSDPKKLVRNQYSANCSTNLQNKWYVDNTSTKPIEHAGNNDVVTRPAQPSCGSALLNIPNSGITFNYSAHCLANGNRPASSPDCSCYRCCIYQNISLGLSQQRANTASLTAYLTSTIDHDRTSDLLTKINSGSYTNVSLRDTLLSYSPYLSDTVLKKYFSNSTVTAVFAASVHAQNKPVTPGVWSIITSRTFTGAPMDSMNARQGRGGVNNRLQLEGYLNLVKADLANIYSEKLNYFLHDTLDGAKDTVIKLLAQNLGGLQDAVPQRVNAYAHGGYYTRAFAYADSLAGDSKYTQLMTLQSTFLQLDTAKKGIYKILDNSTLMGVITNYASDSTKAGSYAARAILHEVTGAPMNFFYLLPETGEGARLMNSETNSEQTSDEKKESSLIRNTGFKLYPNPTHNSFTIIYQSSVEVELKYSIINVLGNEIMTGKVNVNKPEVINAEVFNNGIYFITLIQDSKIIEQKKLIIMK